MRLNTGASEYGHPCDTHGTAYTVRSRVMNAPRIRHQSNRQTTCRHTHIQPNPSQPTSTHTQVFLEAHYGTAIDVWSAGCIMAEMLQRKPLFMGSNTAQMLRLVVQFTGKPSEADLTFVTNKKVRQTAGSLTSAPQHNRRTSRVYMWFFVVSSSLNFVAGSIACTPTRERDEKRSRFALDPGVLSATMRPGQGRLSGRLPTSAVAYVCVLAISSRAVLKGCPDRSIVSLLCSVLLYVLHAACAHPPPPPRASLT